MRSQVFIGSIFLFFAAASTTAADTQPASKELIIAVKGEAASEGVYTLAIEPGKFATRAIRIYSEPSHALLALLLDKSFRDSQEGEVWRDATLADQEAMATMTGKLPEARPLLHIRPRPKGDTKIAVWINGSWPDGATEDRLAAEALVGGGGFAFSGYFVDSSTIGSEKAELKFEWCCSSPNCDEMCKECTGFQFSCCVVGEPECCWIECGWVPACSCQCNWMGECEQI